MKNCELGRIVSHNLNTGYSFKIIMPSLEEAIHYKEMMGFILKSDDYEVKDHKSYYEDKDSNKNYQNEKVRV